MIAPPAGVKVLVATKPMYFRKGANGLAALIKDEMRADPFSGVVYVFRAKRADRIKLLYWDDSGVVLVAKTLGQGVFRWPKIQDGAMRLSASQLSALLDGMDWARVYNVRRTRVPITAHRACDRVTQGGRGGASKPCGHGLILIVTGLADALPDDVQTLKAMLLAERARADRLSQIIKELQRHRFGRRAETLPIDQLELGLENVQQVEAAGAAEAEAKDRAARAAKAGHRRTNRGALPTHLPRF